MRNLLILFVALSLQSCALMLPYAIYDIIADGTKVSRGSYKGKLEGSFVVKENRDNFFNHADTFVVTRLVYNKVYYLVNGEERHTGEDSFRYYFRPVEDDEQTTEGDGQRE